MRREFSLPAGKAPVTGEDLLRVFEAQPSWTVTEAEPGLLAEFRKAQIETAERERPHQMALLHAWFREAGFMLEGEAPSFTLRRGQPR
jgi:hypothetical protein